MFTGIIEHSGVVEAYDRLEFGARIRVSTTDREPFVEGESVAVNGVCLTVLQAGNSLAFDVSDETLARTTLGNLGDGARVNLERSLMVGQRLGGHLVQGHVDAVGRLASIESQGDFAVHRWSFPQEFAKLIVAKGSVAVDGVSLTVVAPDVSSFGAALIPETLRRTTLGTARIGDSVNLEFDIIGKYVRNLALPYLTNGSL
jgi:riboflavin synthase